MLSYLLARPSGQGCPGLGLLGGICGLSLSGKGRRQNVGTSSASLLFAGFLHCLAQPVPGYRQHVQRAVGVGLPRRLLAVWDRQASCPVPTALTSVLFGTFPASALPSLDAALQAPFHCCPHGRNNILSI